MSALITQRRDLNLKLDSERMQVMLEGIKNIRVPVFAVGMATASLENNRVAISKALKDSPANESLGVTFESAMVDLHLSYDRLQQCTEQSVILGTAITSKAGARGSDSSSLQDDELSLDAAADCNILDVLNRAKKMVSLLPSSDSIKWFVDDEILRRGRHKSHPDEFKFMLMMLLGKVITAWTENVVQVHFHKKAVVSGCAVCLDDEEVVTDGSVIVEIRSTNCKLENPSEAAISEMMKTKSVDRVLRDVRGTKRMATFKPPDGTPKEYEYVVEFSVPLRVSYHKALSTPANELIDDVNSELKPEVLGVNLKIEHNYVELSSIMCDSASSPSPAAAPSPAVEDNASPPPKVKGKMGVVSTGASAPLEGGPKVDDYCSDSDELAYFLLVL